MTATFGFFKAASLAVFAVALTVPVLGQTYQLGSNGQAKPQAKPNKTQSAPQNLGFGSNIQNARLAHAAELALRQGDHTRALDYAQRAAQSAPNNAQLWFLVGYAARLDGKYQLSVDAYNRALRLQPGAVEGLSGLAQTYSAMGRSTEAETLLEQILTANPNRRNDALLLGNLYLRAGDYTDAVEWLRRAERLAEDARSELLLAIAYQHLKKPDLAKRYLDKAKSRAPNNPDVQRALAAYYRSTGEYAAALAALKSIQHPSPDVVAELAFTYQLDGNTEKAAGLYTQAANAMPRNLGLQLSAAQAQIAAGSIHNAAPFLERAARIDSNYYRLHVIRAEVAQQEQRYSDAAHEYTSALAALPQSPMEGPLYGIQLHMNLLETYRDLNEPDAAQGQLATAQKEIAGLDVQGADRPRFLRLRALIEMNTGDLTGALRDAKEALTIAPHDVNNLQLDGDLLAKLGQTQEAIARFKQVLTADPKNQYALTSIAYAERAAGNDRAAERYFRRLTRWYPDLFVPYLGLGDMYTARREYAKAQIAYAKGHKLAPTNALIVAGGMNAAIEAHNLPLAGTWLQRVTKRMDGVPHVMREQERYYYFTGNYRESAKIGRKAIAAMPQDRDVVVYLGYDLLYLQKYEELRALTAKYMTLLPQEADIPLLAGYVDKYDGNREQAIKDFSEAVTRNPATATAYVNRGYIYNDLRQPTPAAADFETALKLEPGNGQAHLGLAYADLQLGRSEDAIRQSEFAQRGMGDSQAIHVIRATAYGREGRLTQAADEYRAAIKFTPNDGALYYALGNALLSMGRNEDALHELRRAAALDHHNPMIYATMARAYAAQGDREHTLQYAQKAEHTVEQHGGPTEATEKSDVYLTTGKALSTIGDQSAAMERFRKALAVPGADRVSVRFAIARIMAQQGRTQSAQRQVALATMEAEAGMTEPVTGPQYLQAASIFQQMHEYKLSQTYVRKAQAAGASDIYVRVVAANNYLALGETGRAAAELAAVSAVDASRSDYQYLLAQANLYAQEHRNTQALSSFAAAASAAGNDPVAERSLLRAGGNEGYRVNSRLSLLTSVIVQPIFDASPVYVLDSKVLGPTPIPPDDTSLLPPPRSMLETLWTTGYHLHAGNWPTIGGFFQLRNARGVISVPATNSILHADTYDYSFNSGLNPTVHLGRTLIQFDSGVQATIRRDRISPKQLNQNLFRAFTYFSTGSFFNVVSVSGYGIYEAGPFTESNLHSRTASGAIDFRVGAPWGKTAMVTGWGASDQNFTPEGVENYYTSSYIGLTHRFSERWNAEGIVEDLRDWRVYKTRSGIAQALRPAATVNFSPTRNWNIQATTVYENTRSFHVYDNTQNGISISYGTALGHRFHGSSGEIHLKYPIRFAVGFRQETFFNFNHGNNQTFRPYISVTLF